MKTITMPLDEYNKEIAEFKAKAEISPKAPSVVEVLDAIIKVVADPYSRVAIDPRSISFGNLEIDSRYQELIRLLSPGRRF